MFVSAFILAIGFYFYKSTLSDFYPMPIFLPSTQLLSSISQFLITSTPLLQVRTLPIRSKRRQPGLQFLLYLSHAWYSFFMLLASFFSPEKSKWRFSWHRYCRLSSRLYTVFSKDIQPRYLLPVMGTALLSLVFLVHETGLSVRLCYIICLLLIIPGAIATFYLKDFSYTTLRKDSLGRLVNHLEQLDCHYVYGFDYMLTYQLDFYSKEHVIARERMLPGRYPLSPGRFDNALNQNLKTALICDEFQIRRYKLDSVEDCSGYKIAYFPKRAELAKSFALYEKWKYQKLINNKANLGLALLQTYWYLIL